MILNKTAITKIVAVGLNLLFAFNKISLIKVLRQYREMESFIRLCKKLHSSEKTWLPVKKNEQPQTS